MNDSNAEKIFNGFVNVVRTAGDERGKNISMINEILDRIKVFQEPPSNSATPLVRDITPSNDVPFIERLRAISDNIEADNRRLQKIVSRLNELI